jgi:HTH-type transcriptional regulator/antitoxin HigA
MMTGSRTPSSYYMGLINAFPPRPITNEADLLATQAQIHSILDKGNLTQDDRDYLKVLGILVYDYEDKYEPMPPLSTGKLLQALMEESKSNPG